MNYIGIDPGFKGAVAIIYENGTVKLIDTPTLKVGTRKDYMIQEMTKALSLPTLRQVAIEKVHSMPRQGVASAFTFGKGYGIWLGILGALHIPYEEVTPQRWQREMMDSMQRGKDASRLRAMQLFPQVADQLNLKKHDGRADALLLAEYRRRLG